MIIQPIFSSFIVEEMLTLDNISLEQYVYECLEQKHTHTINILDEKFKELLYVVSEKFNEVYNLLDFNKNTRLQITQSWINLNRRHDINSPHQHPGHFLSACYYVKTDSFSDNLEFVTPIGALEHIIDPKYIKKHNIYNSSKWTVTPVTGKLVIFPSWLFHYVKMNNESVTDRISIAFNTNVVIDS